MSAAVLVTGAAGFIGMHVAERLLARGERVIGLDDLNAYYDPSLKEARLARLRAHARFEFVRLTLADRPGMESVFARGDVDRVVHLAAQAGVRHSIDHPHDYIDANRVGFLHVLEGCRHARVRHLVYASTSSVYGLNTKMPFSVHDDVSHPMSLYAATKRANELMAHTYSHLYGLPTTGLRFFTVYGPWGRPDMALFKFARAILAGEPIDVYNNGDMQRDFTYVDDIAEGVVRALAHPATPNPAWDAGAPDPASSSAPYRVYNIGNSAPVQLLRFIAALEHALGKSAVMRMLPMQPGDVPATSADVTELIRDVGFAPATPVEEGVRRFAEWYLAFYAAPATTGTPIVSASSA
ncbi:MAG TPA: NAD-dependent epimerase [Gemmatirosa sp.]